MQDVSMFGISMLENFIYKVLYEIVVKAKWGVCIITNVVLPVLCLGVAK